LLAAVPVAAWATHEADHRFTVEGFVCGSGGRPNPNVEVVVKDTRVSIGATVLTDEDGYYKAILHLHNDNLGDPVLVIAGSEEQRIKVQFDPKDLETERRVLVNFGSGCEKTIGGPPRSVYYASGMGVAVAVVFAGLKWFRKRRRQVGRRDKKSQGKRKTLL
jgi:hypothetical protein